VSTDPAHAGPTELERDLAYLNEHYPALEIRRSPLGATAIGPIEVTQPDGSTVAIEVGIDFSGSHPARAPRSYDAAGRWDPDLDRHIITDRNFCLFLARVDEPNMREPAGVEVYMNELESFLRQQLILDSQRRFDPDARFPGPEWPHGSGAYILFCHRLLLEEPAELREAMWAFRGNAGDPCFCGSGGTYADCHRSKKLLLIRAAGNGEIQGMSYEQLVDAAKKIEAEL
jgi:hypothetical protein